MKAVVTIATILMLTIAINISSFAWLETGDPNEERRSQEQSPSGESNIPLEDLSDLSEGSEVIDGKKERGNFSENLDNDAGGDSAYAAINPDKDEVQKALDNSRQVTMEKLKQEYETLKATFGTAKTKAEREAARTAAATCLAKAQDPEATIEESKFWMNAYNQIMAQLQSEEAPLSSKGAPKTEGRGIIFWLLTVGLPIVVVAGIIAAIIMARSSDEDEDDDNGDDDDDGDDDDGGDDDGDGGNGNSKERHRNKIKV